MKDIRPLEQIKDDRARTMQFEDWDRYISYYTLKHPELVDNILYSVYKEYELQFEVT